MTPRPVSTALGELGHGLRGLREQAGRTGTELAEQLGAGWSQPKVSKIENGRQLPSEPEVLAWAAATGADPAPVLALRGEAAVDYLSHKDRHRRAGGLQSHQDDLTALAESCTFLAEFQPALIPGRLQTAAYMRQLSQRDPTIAEDGIGSEALGHIIATKLRRQAILHEPGREFVHVVTEAALQLRFRTISYTTLRGQLTHLAELATLPGHTFAVLPFTTACPVMPSNFAMYDRDLVRIETRRRGPPAHRQRVGGPLLPLAGPARRRCRHRPRRRGILPRGRSLAAELTTRRGVGRTARQPRRGGSVSEAPTGRASTAEANAPSGIARRRHAHLSFAARWRSMTRQDGR